MLQKRVCWLLVLGALSSAWAAPFVSQKYKFAITPPAGWTHRAVPGFAAEFFFAPQQGASFNSNLNVLEPIPNERVAPARACTLNVEGIARGMPGAKVRSHRFDAKTAVCHIEYTGSPQGTPLNFYAQLHFVDKAMYTLTFTARGQEYARLLPQVRTAFASFRVQR